MAENITHYCIINRPVNCPVGDLLLGADQEHLCFVGFGIACLPPSTLSKAAFCSEIKPPVLAQAVNELQEYLNGDRRYFTLPIIARGTPFQKTVWEALLNIPYGTTVSYGEIAAQIDGKQKARAVGGAVHNNPLSIIIPCHRVIGADGSLTGFGGGLAVKKWLLTHEAENRG